MIEVFFIYGVIAIFVVILARRQNSFEASIFAGVCWPILAGIAAILGVMWLIVMAAGLLMQFVISVGDMIRHGLGQKKEYS